MANALDYETNETMMSSGGYVFEMFRQRGAGLARQLAVGVMASAALFSLSANASEVVSGTAADL